MAPTYHSDDLRAETKFLNTHSDELHKETHDTEEIPERESALTAVHDTETESSTPVRGGEEEHNERDPRDRSTEAVDNSPKQDASITKMESAPTTEKTAEVTSAQDLATSKYETPPEGGSAERRNDWDTIRAIPDAKFEDLVREGIELEYYETHIRVRNVQVLRRREGSYNHVVIVGLTRASMRESYVVRVPAHGTKALWKEEDKYMMKREVELMRQIQRNTKIPIPNVIGFNEHIDDDYLGAPYILMEMLPGQIAYNIWFDQPYDDETAYLTADVPSLETHRKRLNLLKSLAGYMTELQYLKFDRIGMPGQEMKAGHFYVWPSARDVHKVVKRGPFSSTQEYIETGYDERLDIEKFRENPVLDDPEESVQLWLGTRKVMEIVAATAAPFNMESETFVIHHKDLDLQNILTDKNGFVTGIIDWDGAYAAPRCIGSAAAAPKFLIKDWFPDENGEYLEESPHMAWNMGYYRNLYAAAVHEAELQRGISADAKYTSKSALYQATFCALYEGSNPFDLTNKILRRIPDMSQHPNEFKVMLGRGFPAAEKMLMEEIPKIFAPELPKKKFMQELSVGPTNVPSLQDADNIYSMSISPLMVKNLVQLVLDQDLANLEGHGLVLKQKETALDIHAKSPIMATFSIDPGSGQVQLLYLGLGHT